MHFSTVAENMGQGRQQESDADLTHAVSHLNDLGPPCRSWFGAQEEFERGVISGSDAQLATDVSEEFFLSTLCLDSYLIARVEKAKPFPPSLTEICCSGVSYIFYNRY